MSFRYAQCTCKMYSIPISNRLLLSFACWDIPIFVGFAIASRSGHVACAKYVLSPQRGPCLRWNASNRGDPRVGRNWTFFNRMCLR